MQKQQPNLPALLHPSPFAAAVAAGPSSPMIPTLLFDRSLHASRSDTSSVTTASAMHRVGQQPDMVLGAYIEDRLKQVVDNAEAALSGKKKSNSAKKKRRVSDEQNAKREANHARRHRKAEEKVAKEAEAARLVKVRSEIDILVKNFKPEYYYCVKIHQVKHPKNTTDDADYNVAHEFVIKEGKPNEKRYQFDDFTNTQLRRICVNCNIRGGGGFSNWQAVTALASWATAGTVYNNTKIANPMTTSSAKRLNTYMRIVNVCFLSTMVQRFVDLNDRKKREDYEKSSGTDPIKDFFVEASNICNDATMNIVLSGVAGSQEDEDEHLFEWFQAREFNLNDFDPQTYQTCQSKAYDLLKARELAVAAMKKSGVHDSDFWNFASNPSFLKWRQGMTPVPAQAVYYVHIMCAQYPSIDGKFADKLAETLKSDSSVAMIGEAGSGCSVRGSDRKVSRGEREMMKKMDAVMEQQSEFIDRSYHQRQEFIDLQKESNAEKSEHEAWKEYTLMSERFLSLKTDPVNNVLLYNIAKRLCHLEKKLGIPESSTITGGFVGRD
jgi:hypothetical protein